MSFLGGALGHPVRALALVGLVMSVALNGPPSVEAQSPPCPDPHFGFDSSCLLGSPDANGVTVKSRIRALDPPQLGREAWDFVIPPGDDRSVHLNLQDLWYDMGLQLWEKPTGRELGEWLFKAKSEGLQRRVVQFVRPQIIVRDLPPNTYTVFVYPGPDATNPAATAVSGETAVFDPNRGYTLRVALGPPSCGTAQNGNFQVELTLQPSVLTPFSLVSANAFIDPPYTDLFDFDWTVDGKPVFPGARQTIQFPASAAGPGTHQIGVTARGVRQYPDPDAPFVPPTVAVGCSFGASTAAPGQPAAPANLGSVWQECEGVPPLCGNWARQPDGSWLASWANGDSAILTITISGKTVIGTRSSPKSPLRGTYIGALNDAGNQVSGTVNFWGDAVGNRSGTWQANITQR